MLAIGIIICVVFVLLIQVIIHDLQSIPGPSFHKNDSNVSLSNVLSDSLVNSWLDDSHSSADWKVPYNQHSDNSSIAESERAPVASGVNSKFPATNIHDVSNSTKENFLETLLRLPSKKVEPDWSVVLGTFEYVDNDNWDNYLAEIGLPYLVTLFLGSMTETITMSQIFMDEIKDTKVIDKKSLTNELETTSANFELLMEAYSWPITHSSQFRLRETTIEHDIDGSSSMTFYFFTAPRFLVQEKFRNPWNFTTILHFDERGLNMTSIELNRMVMATRFLSRVD